MNVTAMINRLDYLKEVQKGLKMINSCNKLDITDDINTLANAADIIEDYIDELMRKEVKM